MCCFAFRPTLDVLHLANSIQTSCISDCRPLPLCPQNLIILCPDSGRNLILKNQFYFDCNCVKCCEEEEQPIDYQRFKQLLSHLHQSISDDSESVLIDSDSQIEELISLCHQIYGDFHPELAAILMVVMQFRLLCPQSKCSPEEISRFIGGVGRVIELSFGSNH